MSQRTPRILVIDDNPAIHRDFAKILRPPAPADDLAAAEAVLFDADPAGAGPAAPGYRLDTASQGQDGLELVRRALADGDPYSVAFVDMRMPPGWDGVRTVEEIWRLDHEIQTVFCTAYSDCSWDEMTRRLGISDRLLILKKPFDTVEVEQLAAALSTKWELGRQARLKLAELESLVQARTAELREAALHDRLTGLPNRALLNDRLVHAIERAARDPRSQFAVLFLDCDRFKVINDSLGHELGDLLLVGIAERLRAALRATDTVSRGDGGRGNGEGGDGGGATAARLGGDEFVLLLDGLRDPHDATRLAERVSASLAQPYALKGHDVHVTVSIGITTSATGYQSAADVLRDADTALYRAKAAGRSRYALFDADMHRQAMTRLTIENDLRRAADEGQFVLHYQPIVSLTTGRLTGFEALLRWRHPTLGTVPPDDFVSIAEEIGLIVPIGAWVLEEACRQLGEWRRQFPAEAAGLAMNVNLSPRQLASPQLLPLVERLARSLDAPPHLLHLEITESALMQDPDHCAAVLRELRALGVRLYMDDFGTGHSSLSCLRRFPLDGLKIDRAFVREISGRRDFAAVVHAVIILAHNLNMELTAEGVEHADQLSMLQALECDQGQGYLFARPLAAAAAAEFIRGSNVPVVGRPGGAAAGAIAPPAAA